MRWRSGWPGMAGCTLRGNGTLRTLRLRRGDRSTVGMILYAYSLFLSMSYTIQTYLFCRMVHSE